MEETLIAQLLERYMPGVCFSGRNFNFYSLLSDKNFPNLILNKM